MKYENLHDGESFPAKEKNDAGEVSYPLTLQQLDFWEEFSFHPDEPVSTVAHYVDIRGDVDVEALARAVKSVVDEADVLSIRFLKDSMGNGVRQCLDDGCRPVVSVVDLRGSSTPMDDALQIMNEDCSSRLDLLRDPVSRTMIIRVSDDHCIWYLRSHHIVVDGFSMALMEKRCGALYGYFRGKEPAGAPFGRLEAFLEEERSYRTSDRHARDGRYWQGLLSGGCAPALLDKADEDYGQEGHHDSRRLDDHLIRRLRDFSDDLMATWPDTLVALSILYLSSMGVVADCDKACQGASDNDVIWIPYMGRWGSVAANIPALVVNILPFRAVMDGKASLGEYMASTYRRLNEMRRHGRYRVEQMALDRSVPAGRRFFFSPLINVLPFSGSRFQGCTSESRVLAAGPGDGFNMTFRSAEDGSGLFMQVDVDERSMTQSRLLDVCVGFQPFLEAAMTPGRLDGPLSNLLGRAIRKARS